MRAFSPFNLSGPAMQPAKNHGRKRLASALLSAAYAMLLWAPSPAAIAAPPMKPATIRVVYSPFPLVAGQTFRVTWTTTNADGGVQYLCTSSDGGLNEESDVAQANGFLDRIADPSWVGHDSSCTWRASGLFGDAEDFWTVRTVVGAANPPPTLTLASVPPQPMTVGQSFTVGWNTTNATSINRICKSAVGGGYKVNAPLAVPGGSISDTALSTWVGYDSTCTVTAKGLGGTVSADYVMRTVAAQTTPAPTLTVSRTPSQMIAGQPFSLHWETTNATSLTRICTAAAGGFTVNDAPSLPANTVGGTALDSWVGHDSTCTWTANGPGGSKQVSETMVTVAPTQTTPAPTITVTRNPNPMVSGQAFTLTWSTTNATSLKRVCTSSGGFTVSDTPALNGNGIPGTASPTWVGHDSTCTWTAAGPGGSKPRVETMVTVAAASTSGVTYIHTDGLGSPVARTDGNGTLISRTNYEPYGLTASGAVPTIGFTGHVNDADTGLVYMQQRYYDPIAGRMLSIDPVTTDADTGSSFNRYSYANSSPYKFIDPDGRDPLDNQFHAPSFFTLTTIESSKRGTTLDQAVQRGELTRNVTMPTVAIAASPSIVGVVGTGAVAAPGVASEVAGAVVEVAATRKAGLAALALVGALGKAVIHGPKPASLPQQGVAAALRTVRQIGKDSKVLKAEKVPPPPPPPKVITP